MAAKKTAAKRKSTARKPAGPKKVTTLKVVTHSLGYTGTANAHPREYAWVRTDQVPSYRAGKETHFYIDGYTHVVRGGPTNSNITVRRATDEWETDAEKVGVFDETTMTITLDDPMEVGGKYAPPPGPFDDNAENRKVHKLEADAIRKVLDAMLEFDNLNQAVEAVKSITGSKSFTLNLLDNPQQLEELQATVDAAQPLIDAVQGLSAEQRKRVLRHAAHYYNIPKGSTSLR